MKALIDPNGLVAQLENKEFPVHEDWKWVEASANVESGWRYEKGSFIAPPPIKKLKPEEIPTQSSHLEKALIAKGILTNADIVNAKE